MQRQSSNEQRLLKAKQQSERLEQQSKKNQFIQFTVNADSFIASQRTSNDECALHDFFFFFSVQVFSFWLIDLESVLETKYIL